RKAALFVCPLLAAAQAGQQFRRRIGVGRKTRLFLHVTHRRARLRADDAVDLADVVTAARQQLLQFARLLEAQAVDLSAAGTEARRTRDTGREIGGRRRVDQRLV